MTRNEYLIDLLMESADALMESMGRNGEESKKYGSYAAHHLAFAKRLNKDYSHESKKMGQKVFKDAYKDISRGSAKAAQNRMKLEANQPGGFNNPYGKMYDKIGGINNPNGKTYSKKGTHSIRNGSINQAINDNYNGFNKESALRYKDDMRYGQKNIFGGKKSPKVLGRSRVTHETAINEAIDLLAEATDILTESIKYDSNIDSIIKKLDADIVKADDEIDSAKNKSEQMKAMHLKELYIKAKSDVVKIKDFMIKSEKQ